MQSSTDKRRRRRILASLGVAAVVIGGMVVGTRFLPELARSADEARVRETSAVDRRPIGFEDGAVGSVVPLDEEPAPAEPAASPESPAGEGRPAPYSLHVGSFQSEASALETATRLERAGWTMPDPTTLVFRLRRGARFADGSPVTARDVRSTYEAVRDPALASPKRAALALLAGVETPDDGTVVMRLESPSATFLDATGLGILPADRAWAPTEVGIGAGPFRLVRALRGDRVLLEPNPAWVDGPPRLRSLVVRIVPDEVVRVLELARDEEALRDDHLFFLDVAREVDDLQAVQQRRRDGVQCVGGRDE